jgi:Ribosomal protein L16p/L10e
MGKGKGGFDHWGMNAQPGKVLFEIAASDLRVEIAREALLEAGKVIPGRVQFVQRKKLVQPAVVGFQQSPLYFAGRQREGPVDRKIRTLEIPVPIFSKQVGYEKLAKERKGLVRR